MRISFSPSTDMLSFGQYSQEFHKILTKPSHATEAYMIFPKMQIDNPRLDLRLLGLRLLGLRLMGLRLMGLRLIGLRLRDDAINCTLESD
jgi:hypothetical protein